MKPLRALFVVLLSIPFFAQTPSNLPAETDWDAAGAAWWSHVQYLADDKLQGRLPGTPGFESATQYVVNQFKAIGLKPAGTNGFLQPIKLFSFRTDDDKSSVELVSADKHVALKPGKDITLSPHVASGSAVDAPLVFIGYGLHLPSKHIDDLAGLDLHGKIVVLYNGAPSKLQGPLRAYARMPAQRWHTLKAAGVIGIISINPPRPLPGTAPAPGTAHHPAAHSIEKEGGFRIRLTAVAPDGTAPNHDTLYALAVLDLRAGHVRTLEIAQGSRSIQPLHTAPWVEDASITGDTVGRHDFLLTPCSLDTFAHFYPDLPPHRG